MKAQHAQTDLKIKYDKQKKLLASQKKNKRQVREKDRELMKYKRDLNDKNDELSTLKEEHTKKIKDKDFEIHRLKSEIEKLKNKPPQTVFVSESNVQKQTSKSKSGPSSVRESIADK